VGRSQSYKRWDVAEKAVAAASRNGNSKVVFIRIDGAPETIRSFEERGATRMGGARYLKSEGVLLLPVVSDEVLALSYRVSDLLVHPSEAEGFGLPPVEAALSGLPVLYRKGTAVDEHFADGELPPYFWRGLDTSSEAEWSAAVISMLNSGSELERYLKDMLKAASPREFVLTYAGRRNAFAWKTSASLFLDALSARYNFSEGARN
jgi:glycosyltransferase involved in cell wall biosynthesis